jgi:hypothetical protein
MCFERDSLPPVPIVTSAAVEHREIERALSDAGVEHEPITDAEGGTVGGRPVGPWRHGPRGKVLRVY